MRALVVLVTLSLVSACTPAPAPATPSEPVPVQVPSPVVVSAPADEVASPQVEAGEAPPAPPPMSSQHGCPLDAPAGPPPVCSDPLPAVPPIHAATLPEEVPPEAELAIASARADRASVRTITQRASVRTEIGGLERLLAATKVATERVLIQGRLADAFAELADLEHAAAAGAAISPAERKARQDAARHYDEVAKAVPAHPRQDQMVYRRSREHELLGNLSDARRSYFELIQKYPGSPTIPLAYFAFGELFYRDAKADPSKWALAEQAYKEVIKYPAPSNPVAGFAHLRLGYVQWHQQQAPAALATMRRAVDHSHRFAASAGSDVLRATTVRAMAGIYAEVGRADRACAFFHGVVASPPDAKVTISVLDQLGNAYWTRGDKVSAVTIHRMLRQLDRGPRACSHEAVLQAAGTR